MVIAGKNETALSGVMYTAKNDCFVLYLQKRFPGRKCRQRCLVRSSVETVQYKIMLLDSFSVFSKN